ncbi:MAG TPA: SOS response-associated peptidase [Methylomirabilota bacterium]|jgi:putative SOS response-associated peptidase YedK|nr:SOS response-associated peptidase [Methylomirabilota bacterium]
MCGRFTLTTDLNDLADRFAFHTANLSFKPHYNIAPSQPVLVVIGGEERRAGLLRWGLIPSWAKDPSIGDRMINARAETVAEKPSFRRALQKRRCLVPADGFYEWKKEGKKKTPMYIRLKSHEPFGFAGLWETWKSPNGEAIHSCTIITTAPNSLMEPIHNRMPVLLPREAEALWLDRTMEDPARLLPLLTPYPAEEMDAYEVSPAVNSPRTNASVCIEPVD